MPKGKGTYGSQVGRPPKKQKYQSGGKVGEALSSVGGALGKMGEKLSSEESPSSQSRMKSYDPFSTKNPRGVPADQAKEALETQNVKMAAQRMMQEQGGLRSTNAQERSQTSPDKEQYKDGGKVSKLYGPKSKSVRRKKKRIGKIADKIVSGSNRKDITDVVKQVNKQSKKYHKIDWEDEWDV